MKLTSLLLTSLVIVFVSSALAQTKELDGQYSSIGLKPDSYDFIQYTMTIQEGKLISKGEGEKTEQIADFKMEAGGHKEFLATLKKDLPKGISLYNGELDLQNNGYKTKVTVAKQILNQEAPRITIYMVAKGQALPLIKLYDSAQTEAFKKALEEVQ